MYTRQETSNSLLFYIITWNCFIILSEQKKNINQPYYLLLSSCGGNPRLAIRYFRVLGWLGQAGNNECTIHPLIQQRHQSRTHCIHRVLSRTCDIRQVDGRNINATILYSCPHLCADKYTPWYFTHHTTRSINQWYGVSDQVFGRSH